MNYEINMQTFYFNIIISISLSTLINDTMKFWITLVIFPKTFPFISLTMLYFTERDAFDTLFDHAPDKLNLVKKVINWASLSHHSSPKCEGSVSLVCLSVCLSITKTLKL